MKSQKLNSLLEPKKSELAGLQKLLAATKNQIDDAVEQGNNALLSLSDEYEELAEKKRNLLREIEALEGRVEKLENKLNYAENTYGRYLATIREHQNEEPEER
jgi:predicted  nucleic acid-binding Zn-ribbon protein